MWADSETNLDFLNYSEVAEVIAELIGDQQLLPLSIGVFGGWGTGKSTTLELVDLELSKNSNEYLIVKFDAWLYQDFDDTRAALMGVISSSIIEKAPEDLKEKATNLLKRVNKLRMLGLLIEGGALALGNPIPGVISKGIDSAITLIEDEQKSTDANSSEGREEGGPPKEIDSFRVEFGDLLNELDKTLVVFIDNIDRCLPANAIHTLEAIRLFLFMPRTAFIVAADEDMIRHAVEHHFHNPSQTHVADYLDKLIQIPMRVPRVGVQETRVYLFLLLCSREIKSKENLEKLRIYLINKLRTSWKQEGDFTVDDVLGVIQQFNNDEPIPNLEIVDRIAPTLALSPEVSGNPRTVKRMLNVVRIRTSIANRRSMPLDEAMITKLALFERCTDNDAAKQLHNIINEASDGKPKLLRRLEQLKPDDKPPTLPKEWNKHSTFLLEWAKLLPALGGVDLRPAVYLARETVPLSMLSVQASSAALHAIETLSKVSSVSSQVGKSALDNLRSEENLVVMDALIVKMRNDSDWRRPRKDFRGAVMTADRSADAALQLKRYVKSLQFEKLPGWMNIMLKEKSWWQE